MSHVTCRGCTGSFVCSEPYRRECSTHCERIVKKRLKRAWRMQQKRLMEPTKSTRAAMFDAVLAAPEDDTARLVYADTVQEETGNEVLAALIRRGAVCWCANVIWDGTRPGLALDCAACESGRFVERCQEAGCRQPGRDCYITVLGEDMDQVQSFFCDSHASANGFCSMCGQFWGGIDSFEATGVCDHCADQLEQDEDENRDDDERWHWEDFEGIP